MIDLIPADWRTALAPAIGAASFRRLAEFVAADDYAQTHELTVHPVEQERAQGDVGRPAGRRQRHGHEGQRDDQQPRPERHRRGQRGRRRSE